MRSITVFNAIKRTFDTGILDNLIEESIDKKSQINQIKGEKTSRTVTKLFQYHFVNTVMVNKKASNLLTNNVIYDSECDYFLTHDKSRFRGEIRPASEK